MKRHNTNKLSTEEQAELLDGWFFVQAMKFAPLAERNALLAAFFAATSALPPCNPECVPCTIRLGRVSGA